ncbi:GTPase HflX [Salinispira pacifica]
MNEYEASQSALLVAVERPGDSHAEVAESLDELTQLVRTIGIAPAEAQIVRLAQPHPRFLLGSGKTDELIARAGELEAEYIVFDDDLSPAQQRNWEKSSSLCVIDRHEVILEIFADRAYTREANLQVALARLEYSLPRLKRQWTHLSRQRGGARGTRGEGETQLEADRRVVVNRIARVKRDLSRVREQRATMRKHRTGVPVPTGAIVGYTNAGKSSLLNRLTRAQVLVEDKLFATLDPTTRRLSLPDGTETLLTDTVGFIRKLPHDLVDAFRSTLEETVLADYLIHVVDASSPTMEHQIAVTRQVLEEIGAGDKPVVMVLNKIDLVESDLPAQAVDNDRTVRVSAATGQGVDRLVAVIQTVVAGAMEAVELVLPSSRHDLAALVHRTGRVLAKDYVDGTIRIRAQLPDKTRSMLERFLVRPDGSPAA